MLAAKLPKTGMMRYCDVYELAYLVARIRSSSGSIPTTGVDWSCFDSSLRQWTIVFQTTLLLSFFVIFDVLLSEELCVCRYSRCTQDDLATVPNGRVYSSL